MRGRRKRECFRVGHLRGLYLQGESPLISELLILCINTALRKDNRLLTKRLYTR